MYVCIVFTFTLWEPLKSLVWGDDYTCTRTSRTESFVWSTRGIEGPFALVERGVSRDRGYSRCVTTRVPETCARPMAFGTLVVLAAPRWRRRLGNLSIQWCTNMTIGAKDNGTLNRTTDSLSVIWSALHWNRGEASEVLMYIIYTDILYIHYIHTYIHTHTHMYTHIHIYICINL